MQLMGSKIVRAVKYQLGSIPMVLILIGIANLCLDQIPYLDLCNRNVEFNVTSFAHVTNICHVLFIADGL